MHQVRRARHHHVLGVGQQISEPLAEGALDGRTVLAGQHETRTAAVPLGALPDGVSFPAALPADLRPTIVFDPGAQELRCVGPLRDPDRDALLALAGNSPAAYEQAVRDLQIRSRAGFD